jgi:3-oxoacyl-ACP reductase-like protein
MMKTVTPWVLSLAVSTCAAAARGAPNDDANAKEWADAERKFVEFITPVLKEARARLNDAHIQWAQVKNDLLRKYLPNVRLYIRDGAYTGETKIWILTRDGQILDLGDGTWTGVGGDQWHAVEKVTAFVKSRKIKVENPEQAVEVTKLVEAIASSPNFVGMLRLNTKDYTVFDERFLRWLYASPDNWKYTAKEKGTGWEVKVEYVGPPASIMQPPTYDLVLDEQKQFTDLRRVRK